ncbi:ABC transporter permease/substrate binding protein [Hazenella coriacea]|uniref:Glycine betaine/proline transport system substrate-binding protein n=1 Tax=Hazenella coriacea TaxID=1179467 RepID=A0A4R3L2H3_9BACL|nr:ABC transporter permease/substrate binding protein [Hazenella coriacea]TCS93659.1 glycine betaine/proline transport system substrate-binding protein [Hazenella coriacea]
MIPKLPLADWIDRLIHWLQINFEALFNIISGMIEPTVDFFERILLVLPPLWTIIIISLFVWWITRIRFAIFSIAGLFLIYNLGYWEHSVQTLALVLTATLISVIIGIPFGLWSGRSDRVEQVIKPLLDFMQTMPAFVYLIPAVFFFSLGTVPGVIASVIFSMPPTIRFSSLGLRQVSKELKEAADAFGSTSMQKLIKVEIPLAKSTIMAGINQTIMLALSMVVTASMIGAEGLGAIVLESITRLQVGKGFESGIAIVIIAILLDRITQSFGKPPTGKKAKTRKWIAPVALLTIASLGVASFMQGTTNKNEVTLTYVNWVSEEASIHVMKNILEQEGFSVKLIRVDPGPMYDAVATGTADALLAAWLPKTHEQYMKRYKNDLDDLGPNLENTKLGLVVPKYVNINSIDDLRQSKDLFNGKIIGVDPGAGITAITKEAIKEYNLNMTLVESSDAGMTAELDKAYRDKKPIVITGWTPHWMFMKYELKYLEDPKETFGKPENIYTLARKGLKEEKPEAYRIIDQFYWTPQDMESVMLDIQNGMTPDDAAKKWIKNHPDQVKKIISP